MITMSRTALAAACYALAAFGLPLAAQAEDRLIWQPTKSGENGMHLRMGIKLPVDGEASAGADVAVAASRSGRVEDTPVDVWARVAVRRGTRTAVVTSRTIDGVFDPRTGNGNLDVSMDRKRILSESFDLERGRSVNVSCNAHLKRCENVVLSQSARLSAVATGTALVAEGNYSSATLDFSNVVRVEQRVTRKMNVTAALAAPFKDDRQPSVSLSYAFNW
ncbi:hypothetical protein DFI02_1283 [Rhizobium sp. PP-F2F-G20b]|nr:hypothetical protein DFI02_1283 [Rhizobium sp. PP-F2F-G20b]